MTPLQQEGIFTVCLLATFADGSKSDAEREEVRQIAQRFSEAGKRTRDLMQDVLLGAPNLERALAPLETPELRALAYEMAVCVCDADGVVNDAEKTFLAELRARLGLAAATTPTIDEAAAALAVAPVAAPAALEAPPPAADADPDGMILRYAILAGALELLPQSLATMAIIPVQMKMVYRIGQAHGCELDRTAIRDLLATAGLGMTSQVLEGYGRKLLGGLLGKVGGKLGRGVGQQTASSTMSFASTYAIGQVAWRYYAGGRQLTGPELKQLFGSLFTRARELHGKYTGQIEQQSRQVDSAKLLELVRGA